MKHIQFLFSLCVLAALLLPIALDFNPQRASAKPNTSCNLSWELVPGPSFPGKSPRLSIIAHSASNDVWAVGRLVEGAPGPLISHPLALHWDGSHWSQVDVPSSDGKIPHLIGVTAISPTDAWAVGDYYYDYTFESVILHWDGTIWSEVCIPDTWATILFDISHVDANDIWAVGKLDQEAVLLRWNGVEWSNLSDPIVAIGFIGLDEVEARATNDVYIAGRMYEDDLLYAGIAHWNGTAWNLIARTEISDGTRPGANSYHWIGGLAVLASDDIWISLGFAGISAVIPEYSFRRWNNGLWETVEWGNGAPLDLAGSEPNLAYGVVRDRFNQVREARYWNGTVWNEIYFPLPKGKDMPFSTVGIISTNEAWVVGDEYNAPNKSQPYIAHGTSPCALPPRPTPLSPDNDQILQRTDPTLKWAFPPGANTFEVILKQVKTPDAPVLKQTVTHSKFKADEPLSPGAIYKWRVRACNNNGCGEWTEARTFSIAETVP